MISLLGSRALQSETNAKGSSNKVIKTEFQTCHLARIVNRLGNKRQSSGTACLVMSVTLYQCGHCVFCENGTGSNNEARQDVTVFSTITLLSNDLVMPLQCLLLFEVISSRTRSLQSRAKKLTLSPPLY